jgi:hypothetical protein
VLAVLFRSDLEVPQPLPKLFSLYLLMVIGLRGGFELRHSGINLHIALVLLAAMGMAVAVPLALAITFPFNISVGIPLYYNLISLFIA